jgi:hypothetical protein
MIIFGCTNRQIHFRNGEIHSFDSYPKLDLDFKPQSLDSKNTWFGNLKLHVDRDLDLELDLDFKPQSLDSKNLD